ncbi:hypothetical protein [uncultured Paludibaculum sp.]|uniref:hypothetical protein n=1 Tax=uncultured Paludibaculum sp. TaxID=1765020 RepID=UPI002AAA8883|nr:hypothetical protein [uncultured Paludibaculum sp.]
MRSTTLFTLLAVAFFLSGCGPEPTPTPAPVKKAATPPADESRRFPAPDRGATSIVADHLLGHEFLPGGNIAHYKKGARAFDLILIRTSSPQAAGILLFEYKQHLENPKVIPSFGGFAGKDGAREAFLFAKGNYVAGVLGLPEADADAIAREFAARIQ